jgi:hypothetical protein
LIAVTLFSGRKENPDHKASTPTKNIITNEPAADEQESSTQIHIKELLQHRTIR